MWTIHSYISEYFATIWPIFQQPLCFGFTGGELLFGTLAACFVIGCIHFIFGFGIDFGTSEMRFRLSHDYVPNKKGDGGHWEHKAPKSK